MPKGSNCYGSLAPRSPLPAIGADTLKRYEVSRETRGGVGVGELDGETCTACRMALPAERVRELQNGPEIGTCPQCRRLIVVRPRGGE